jgi:tRNA(His) guanylyltransferase
MSFTNFIDTISLSLYGTLTITLFYYLLKPLFVKMKDEPEIYPYSTVDEIPFKLDERIKHYENLSQTITKIDSEYPFIIRLDGRCFSKFTKKLKKYNNQPFSMEFKEAMIKTCHDLLHEFKPTTVYTHSDEITMIFNNTVSDNGVNYPHIFGGRVFKILSLVSSFASVRFNNNLKLPITPSDFSKKVSIIHNPTFDARIIVFPKDHEIVNHMIWRSKYDCYRNFVGMYAQKYMSHKKLNNMSTNDRIQYLKVYDIFLDTDDNYIDQSLKYGLFMKLHISQNTTDNLTSFYIFKNINYSENLYDFLLAKNDSYVNIDNLNIHDPIILEISNMIY